MAEAVGLAASVIAIVELSAKLATLCLQYSTSVSRANTEVTNLRTKLNDLSTSLQGLSRLLESQSAGTLPVSQDLTKSLDGCMAELTRLQAKLDPGKARKAMHRIGFRALKWPFDSKEVNEIVTNLERYQQNMLLCLQVDQTLVALVHMKD